MKDTTTKKEPNPGDEYIRIYLPLETQLKLEHAAQDNNVSRGKLITQIIEQYVNEPNEKQDGTAGITKDELNALLEEIHTAKKWLNRTEKRVKTILTETESETHTGTEDSEPAPLDFDVIAFGRNPHLEARTKTVIDIIRELEREEGAANIDKIVERATDAEFSEDDVNKEIARLVQMAEIYEPVDKSGNYLTVLRMERRAGNER